MFWAQLVLPGKWENWSEMEERDRDKEKTLKYATIFAAYLSPGTGSRKLFTLMLSFSSSVPAVSCSLLNQEFGDEFVVLL